MAGQLDPLPRRQFTEDLALEALEPLLQASDLGGAARRVLASQRLDARLKFEERALEIQPALNVRRRLGQAGSPGQASTMTEPGPRSPSTASTNAGDGLTRRALTRTSTSAPST